MAKLISQESIRQGQQGARPFGTPRERPTTSLKGKKWLVRGGNVEIPGGEKRYVTPAKVIATFGLKREECVLWHEGDEEPVGGYELRIVGPHGIADWGRPDDVAPVQEGSC